MTSLGIDIGGTSVKAALLDGERVLAVSSPGPAYARPDRAELLRAIGDAVTSLGVRECRAVGVCAPGLFDASTGRFTMCVNVPGLVGLSLDDLLAPAGIKGVRAWLYTDAHAAAVDFSHSINSRADRALAISLGTGVGACVLDRGAPLVFSGRSPGHFGQIDVSLGEAQPPVGPDGGRGGLEAYIGLPALCARFGCGPGGVGACLATLTAADAPLRALARAIRVGHAMFRPDEVWLLGGVGAGLAPVAPVLDAMVRDGLTSLARAGWVLRAAGGAMHAALGAARLAGSM